MSLHLCGPALTTTGKKKGKVKFRNAEEAQRARQLDADWKQLKTKWSPADLVKKISSSSKYGKMPSLAIPEGRNTTAHIPSRSTVGGNTALKPVNIYTGNKMIGIGQLHKSNAVPVFSSEEAVDISKMRR